MSRLLPIALVLISTSGLGCKGYIFGNDDDHPVGVDTTPGGNTLPVDHPALDAPLMSAGARRVTVEQLRRSVPIVLGNDTAGNAITWKVGTKNGFDENGDTLGEADYVNTTEDNLEPAPLYVKFVDDAARDVCTRALAADAARTDASTRVILRHVEKTDTVQSAAAKVDENLRYLKLRFHAAKDANITPLRTLFDTAVTKAANGATPTAAHVSTGWHVVCVALLTAPEFHIY
jgi:hypothetical protein